MDEILIGEKKYVSSKRAAQMTGYAKDYVGQLCREGRVPARLVGRSWYVLESAIQDHRFGDKPAEPEHKPEPTKEQAQPYQTWEPPRYHSEISSSINLLKEDLSVDTSDEKTPPEVAEDLQASWKAWFDRISASHQPAAEVPDLAYQATDDKDTGIVEPGPAIEEEAVSIPMHVMNREERVREAYYFEQEKSTIEPAARSVASPIREQRKERDPETAVIRVLAIVVALAALATALIGSGAIKSQTISGSRDMFISGVSVYER